MNTTEVVIAIADDHTLFRNGLKNLIQSLGTHYNVGIEASNGYDLLAQIQKGVVPDIAIIDVNMPNRDGFETVKDLSDNYPEIKVLIVSMISNEESVVRMLKLGVKGYLSKDVELADLQRAIQEIMCKGFYYTDFVTGRLLHELKRSENRELQVQLSEREKTFLSFACSELTYKQVADKMHLSVKTVDIYRDTLFKKFNVTSRVGLVIYAIKNKLVDVHYLDN